MKNRTLKFVACLVFQAAGWICLFAGFHGNFPIAVGCFALGNFFSLGRSYLYIGVMAAALIFLAVIRDWTSSHYPVWFMLFVSLGLLGMLLKEFRAWRSSLRNDHTA